MRAALLSLLSLVLASPARGADSSDDARASVTTLLKVVTYDYNFDSRGSGDFVLLVVVDAGDAEKRDALIAALKQLSSQKVKGRALKCVGIDFKDEASLSAEIDKGRVSALLMMPGASVALMKHVWEVAQDSQIYALALETSMVDLGLPVGVQIAGGKPQIAINTRAAKSVGAKFDSAVLSLARIVQ